MSQRTPTIPFTFLTFMPCNQNEFDQFKSNVESKGQQLENVTAFSYVKQSTYNFVAEVSDLIS